MSQSFTKICSCGTHIKISEEQLYVMVRCPKCGMIVHYGTGA